MTLPTPDPGSISSPATPRRSRVPIVVLGVAIVVFGAAAIGCFVAFGMAISDTDNIKFATPGTARFHLTPGSYTICQPADTGLGPRTLQVDSSTVRVQSASSPVLVTELSGGSFCNGVNSGSDDLYEVLAFEIDRADEYTVTVSDSDGPAPRYLTVSRDIDDSVFGWLGGGLLAGFVAGACILALIIVLIVPRRPQAEAARVAVRPRTRLGRPHPAWLRAGTAGSAAVPPPVLQPPAVQPSAVRSAGAGTTDVGSARTERTALAAVRTAAGTISRPLMTSPPIRS